LSVKRSDNYQSAPDAMVFVNRDAKIVLVNAQLEPLPLPKRADAEPHLLCGTLSRPHRENVARYFEQPRVRFMGMDLAIYGLRKDGTEFPADISLSPLETEGGIVAVGAVRDITERKKAEEEKQRLREQLAEAEKLSALGRIAANVADEIRNPLTALGGFARRLQRIADSEKEREYAEYIISEVGRLEGLLRDVLAFSRRWSLLLEDHDIHGILDEALKTWEERCRQQLITVRKSYREGAVVRVDRTQTREAIECLVENAVDAMPHGGTLSVVTDLATIGGGTYVRVRIQDTGEGIPVEKIGKIFEPFFTTRVSPKGTGLGLPIAKSIVEEEGGMIRIESTEGMGTAVTLLFLDIGRG
jgi:PAS domain S-box-containing protein